MCSVIPVLHLPLNGNPSSSRRLQPLLLLELWTEGILIVVATRKG